MRFPQRVPLLVVLLACAGCKVDGTRPLLSVAGPTPIAAPAPSLPRPPGQLISFTDPSTGFTTSEARDARDHIVQFTSDGALVWTADGTRFPGFSMPQAPVATTYFTGPLCVCWLEIRFGTVNGERRAYLTADYGHDNPGTVVILERAGDGLVMTHGEAGPPGTFTLSGVVYEMTADGRRPLADVWVSRPNGPYSRTDAGGAYRLPGLYAGTVTVYAIGDGYQSQNVNLEIDADRRVDIELVRR